MLQFLLRFRTRPAGVVAGQVVSVARSADRTADQHELLPARVEINARRNTKTPWAIARYNRPACRWNFFQDGRRSMLTYLMHPLTKRLAASMTE
jgi:hypothetical protein